MEHPILSLLAARKGHFRFESGHHGTRWLDLDPLFADPIWLQPFVSQLAEALLRHKVRAVCGPLVGGAFLAQTLAQLLHAEFFYTERCVGGTSGELYSAKYRLPNGLRERVRGREVAVVDDVINAGSAVRGTIAALESCGAIPVAIGALLVLGTPVLSVFSDVPLERVAHLPNDLWTPAECPLCAAGVPLDELVADRPAPPPH